MKHRSKKVRFLFVQGWKYIVGSCYIQKDIVDQAHLRRPTASENFQSQLWTVTFDLSRLGVLMQLYVYA